MSIDQARLEDLAARYVEAWNSKVPENVASFHDAKSQIVINRGAPSVGFDELTAMAAGFHADVPDLVLQSDGIRSAGNHVVLCGPSPGTMHKQAIHLMSVAGKSGNSTTI